MRFGFDGSIHRAWWSTSSSSRLSAARHLVEFGSYTRMTSLGGRPSECRRVTERPPPSPERSCSSSCRRCRAGRWCRCPAADGAVRAVCIPLRTLAAPCASPRGHPMGTGGAFAVEQAAFCGESERGGRDSKGVADREPEGSSRTSRPADGGAHENGRESTGSASHETQSGTHVPELVERLASMDPSELGRLLRAVAQRGSR